MLDPAWSAGLCTRAQATASAALVGTAVHGAHSALARRGLSISMDDLDGGSDTIPWETATLESPGDVNIACVDQLAAEEKCWVPKVSSLA